MPVCPRCRIAYLDSESHACQRDAISRVGSPGAGAVLGAVVAIVVAGALTANGQSGAPGVGLSAGVIVGVLIVVLARR